MDFPADLDHLPEMLAFIRTILVKKKVPDQQIYRVELASEEALVNIISYAYPGKQEGEILNVTCVEKGDNQFEITFKDNGIPFNPLESKVEPKVDKPLNEREVGGLGIFLMGKLSENMSYQRNGDENILKMTFRL